jgi:CubicO group peptidase (beta-lactamase class C family)
LSVREAVVVKKARVARMRFGFVVLAALLGADGVMAQSGAPPDLDAYVEQARKTFEVPGIAVAIVKDGKVVVAKGYGVRKMGEPARVDENTLFGIGSNTKAFTSAALATLVDDGKISWDDPVYERLPGFEMYDPYVSHEMTIRDLLTHRSGMGLGEGDLLFWPATTYTRADIIYRLRFMKPASSFRSHFAYDNLMYIAAGQIVSAVTGKSWEDYIREKILEPLGMKTTTLSNAHFTAEQDYAFPHSKLEGKVQPVDFVVLDNAGPAGSINSSVAEMAQWLLLQLNRGKLPNGQGRIFSEKQSQEMWAAETILPTHPLPPPLETLTAHFQDYAFGWFLRDYHGRELIGHSGGVEGFVSRVMLVPEENLGVVILTNADQGGSMESILFHILDYYMGVAPTDWTAAFKTLQDRQEANAAQAMKNAASSRAADSHPSLAMEKYAGVYNDAWYGSATIRSEGEKLVFTLDHTPAAVADLEHWQYDTFKAHWRDRKIEDAFVTFALKPDGSIDHFTMVAVSPLADFSFDYQDLYFKPAASEKK